jgi:hypothetical protein
MQLRRFGLLLPLAQMVLALVVGCSRQSADPGRESAQDVAQTVPGQTGAADSPPPDALQHVKSMPALHKPPSETPIKDLTGELVQTHYRPTPANPAGTLDNEPTAPIEFGRATDYRWLQGELLFSSVRGVWRLRYAAADDNDPYGGSVTLVDVDSHLALHAGQRVRIEGRLINPRSNEPSPFYHVLKLQKK